MIIRIGYKSGKQYLEKPGFQGQKCLKFRGNSSTSLALTRPSDGPATNFSAFGKLFGYIMSCFGALRKLLGYIVGYFSVFEELFSCVLSHRRLYAYQK